MKNNLRQKNRRNKVGKKKKKKTKKLRKGETDSWRQMPKFTIPRLLN